MEVSVINPIVLIASVLASAVVGGAVSALIRKKVVESKLTELKGAEEKIISADKKAEDIKKRAQKDSDSLIKEAKIKAKKRFII